MTASGRIIGEVGSWPGVSVGPGARAASVAFRVGRRELGHVHADHAAHFSFPKDVWDELRREGRIAPTRCFSRFADRSAGGSRPMRTSGMRPTCCG
jgi:hypothetical protein